VNRQDRPRTRDRRDARHARTRFPASLASSPNRHDDTSSESDDFYVRPRRVLREFLPAISPRPRRFRANPISRDDAREPRPCNSYSVYTAISSTNHEYFRTYDKRTRRMNLFLTIEPPFVRFVRPDVRRIDSSGSTLRRLPRTPAENVL